MPVPIGPFSRSSFAHAMTTIWAILSGGSVRRLNMPPPTSKHLAEPTTSRFSSLTGGARYRCAMLSIFSPKAARIVSFIHVPGKLAATLQKDSPFAEVIALNAAARRVRGQYIGRIDQDTLVGETFLRTFFEWIEGDRDPGFPLDSVVLFSNQRMIPYRLRCVRPLWRK